LNVAAHKFEKVAIVTRCLKLGNNYLFFYYYSLFATVNKKQELPEFWGTHKDPLVITRGNDDMMMKVMKLNHGKRRNTTFGTALRCRTLNFR